MTSGGVTSAPLPCPAIFAPIFASGSITRRIGRLDSESSPTSVVAKRWPARSPHSKRIVVPELPQSIADAGARMPSRPVPAITRALPSRVILAPSALIAFAERPLSAPSPRPSTRTGVADSSENNSARWPIDLSPGIVMVPDNGRDCGSTVSFMALLREEHRRARPRAASAPDRSR